MIWINKSLNNIYIYILSRLRLVISISKFFFLISNSRNEFLINRTFIEHACCINYFNNNARLHRTS